MAKAAKRLTVTVLVRNLPVGTTQEQLRDLCQAFGGVVEVEIPRRAALFTKFIFGFVRFVSLDAALTAVLRLNDLVLEGKRIAAEVAKGHWRNTNHATVLHENLMAAPEAEDSSLDLSEDDLDTAVLQMCHQQWRQHARRHPHEELPSFGQIMEMLSRLPDSEDQDLPSGAEPSGKSREINPS